MSKTNKQIRKYHGYKFYKQIDENNIELVRLIKIHQFNDKITIKNEDDGSIKEVPFTYLKGFTPLTPYGKVSFSQVKIFNNRKDKRDGFVKDVIIAAYRDIDMQLEQYEPYAIARQNITDFWYNLLTDEAHHELVGASATRENCPPNIPYAMLTACDEPILYEMISIYLEDTIETLLECIDIKSYDDIFKGLFDDHMKYLNPLYDRSIPVNFDSKNGWCKNLSTFLKENNFIKDIDDMRGIFAFDFNLHEWMDADDKEPNVYHFKEDTLKFFNANLNVNASTTDVIEYGHDIDLAEFNNSNYTLVRDNTGKLFVVVYTLLGKHLEADLEAEQLKISISDKLRMDYYNKYSESQK